MNVHLRAVQPTAIGGVVKTAAKLQAAVAGRIGVGLELELHLKIPELLIREQPDVIVVSPSHRVAQDRSAFH